MFPCLALLLLALLPPVAVSAPIPQTLSPAGAARAIVSSKYPRDSRGETVYQAPGNEDQGATIVPGVLSPPKPLKTPPPKFSKAMRKARYQGEITVEGTITPAGDVIDITAEQPADPEAAQSASVMLSKYKFKPSTLDGKPVAVRLRVTVNFSMY